VQPAVYLTPSWSCALRHGDHWLRRKLRADCYIQRNAQLWWQSQWVSSALTVILWYRVLEKLIVSQLVRKISAVYETLRYITLFTGPYHMLHPGWTTLSPIATSGELAMEVWRHSQHVCNLSDKELLISHRIFYFFFQLNQSVYYLRLMAVVTE
jgi:hypothetical protein